jgi:hypothetical protein
MEDMRAFQHEYYKKSADALTLLIEGKQDTKSFHQLKNSKSNSLHLANVFMESSIST